MFSSYDRTGGNDDGFSGTYSYIRKEEEGLVLAELEGPGAIYRIWTPTPTDDIFAFYFDGESKPRLEISFRQLFTGEREPFVSPIVGYGVGGFYCYLPIAFEKSIKVVARAESLQFYQMNYAIYPEDENVTTYNGYTPEQLAPAIDLFSSAGENISSWSAPPGKKIRTESRSLSLAAGETKYLLLLKKPGRIVGLRLGPASAFAGKARDSTLRMYWDEDSEPAVLGPVGDLFGYSWGDPATRSLLVGTAHNVNYLYFPMPFDRSARIELSSERAIEVRIEADWIDLPRAKNEGRFYAIWRRENPTAIGKPFTFIDTRGRGHIVGAVLQAQGFEPAQTPFFEGDDQATLDGKLVIHGTGSEDFFNGGWYNVIGRWMSRLSMPLSGCLDYKNPLARTGGYRLMLTDAYSFRESALLTIEHSPTKNSFPTDYAGVTYFYSENRPTMDFSIPPRSERRVVDPDRIVFSPGWSVPVDSFSFRNMTLTKRQEKIGGQNTRYLRVRAEAEDMFGPHSIAFRCELPEAGTYQVSIEGVKGPDQGMVQIYRNEKAEGQVVDFYQTDQQRSGPMPLASLDFVEGENVVLMKLVGKHPDSSGLGLDIVTISFERL
ncbi:MAG: DUF2961 domain-containing protein [Verrucomicrobiae bacterium]|nr:DUF2961 domain-containing protein [Verrucomicrobiae bacterium]